MNNSQILGKITEAKSVYDYSSYPNSNNLLSATGLNSIREIVRILRGTELFKTEISQIKKSQWYDGQRDSKNISQNENNAIINLYRALDVGERLFSDLIDKYAIKEDHTINIYLPKKYTFGDLQNLSNDFKKAIEIPSTEVGGTAEVASAHPGSIWFEVIIGSSAAVALIGRIVSVATKANIEIQKGKILSQYARELELKNDVLDNMLDKQKKVINKIVEDNAHETIDSLGGESDTQSLNRMKLAIESMIKILQKGIKVLPSAKEDEIVKNLFPTYQDDNNLLQEEIMKLSSPNESDG